MYFIYLYPSTPFQSTHLYKFQTVAQHFSKQHHCRLDPGRIILTYILFKASHAAQDYVSEVSEYLGTLSIYSVIFNLVWRCVTSLSQ